MERNNLRLFSAVLLAALFGCGGRQGFVPVSGRVTMDGKPLANVHVHFQPTMTDGNPNPGPGSYAETDKEGKYALAISSQHAQGDGAVVGKHMVRISSKLEKKEIKYDPQLGSPDGAPLIAYETIPAHYNQDTTLEYTVPPGGTSKADFDLATKAAPKK